MGASTRDWTVLADAVAGEVLSADSADYDSVRRPAIARFGGIRPEAVVRCTEPADVAEAVTFARRFGMPVAVRSGGHCFAGRSSSAGMVVDVSPMTAVSVSGDTLVAGAGARLGTVYDELSRHGRALPAGCGPTVGISGLTLGGGLGVLGRTYGLTCDNLRAAQVVLADGRVVECDDERDPDLFWALRGTGGGTVGVVTSLVFRTVIEPMTTVFHLIWPSELAADVLVAWQSWAPSAPDELAASLLITVDGGTRAPVVNVFGSMIGTESDTGELLDGLVSAVGVDPSFAERREAPYRETKRYLSEVLPLRAHAGEPVQDGHMASRSEFFRAPLPPEVAARLVEQVTDGLAETESRELDLSPWGGAYNRVPDHATAFAHRGESFLLKHASITGPDATAAERTVARRWLDASYDTPHPWGTGGVFPNFPEPELDPWDPRHVGSNRDRLVRVGHAYDPDGLFADKRR